ncbi:MAG: hypothetical protein DMF84_13225 [Acidobacteria bacterium]|nr:MAG: hypothetical protein DMF84_13225 [Acidobacteriota bacterium]
MRGRAMTLQDPASGARAPGDGWPKGRSAAGPALRGPITRNLSYRNLVERQVSAAEMILAISVTPEAISKISEYGFTDRLC